MSRIQLQQAFLAVIAFAALSFAALSASAQENGAGEVLFSYRRDATDQTLLTRGQSEEPQELQEPIAFAAPSRQESQPALPPSDSMRRLAPTTSEGSRDGTGSNSTRVSGGLALAPKARQALVTAATALGAVVALLLLSTWALKRRGPGHNGALPPEAFCLLGRAQLGERTTVQLFRLGNKLVLAASTPDGVRPLTEVTDAEEVDRIAGLCIQGRVHGPAAEFQQVLAQLSREPARGFLGSEGQRA
ncbi:MAG: flagellar biosynthetic protein FliO [Planctomycetales bacterium]|nr:flagellar biosynthetic protein FliO [Planctomycetales bacterium]